MGDILLVDNSDQDAEVLERVLREARVRNRIVRMDDGTQALAHLKSLEEKLSSGGPPLPAILLMSLHLPGLSGFDILADLQPRKAFSKILRIVLSDLQNTESIKRAYALGAQTFLSKPIHQIEIKELIKTYPDYWTLN
jgi:CheY-like chemotaxis protein